MLSQCFLVDFLKKKIEKKVGIDLDGDGRIGGSGHGSGGPMGQVEKALNVDLNQDGRIGGGAAAGHKPSSGSGGKSVQQEFFCFLFYYRLQVLLEKSNKLRVWILMEMEESEEMLLIDVNSINNTNNLFLSSLI